MAMTEANQLFFFGFHLTSYILAIFITGLLIINKIIGWMRASFDYIS